MNLSGIGGVSQGVIVANVGTDLCTKLYTKLGYSHLEDLRGLRLLGI